MRLGSRLLTRVGPGSVMAAGMAVLAVGMLLFSRIDTDGSWARDLLALFVPTRDRRWNEPRRDALSMGKTPTAGGLLQ